LPVPLGGGGAEAGPARRITIDTSNAYRDCTLVGRQVVKIRQATLIVAAASAALIPVPPGFVERLYSNGVYARVQPAVTSFSNLIPFAAFDVFVGGLVFLWILLTVRDIRSRPGGAVRRAGRIAVRAAVWSASLYLLFLVTWGLNYRRTRLQEKLAFRAEAITVKAAQALANAAVEQVNTLHDPAHAAGWGSADAIDPELAAALARAVHEVGGRSRIEVARPKHTVLDWYFRKAAVSGMTDPFLLETLVASDVLPFERPFVIAHEWSHVAGIAHEGEANFVAWLACVRGSKSHRYSGWLMLYEELLPSVGREERTALAGRLAAGPRDDLRASRERLLKNVNPRVSAVGWRFYDSFLKVNRIESGAASYAEVVQLVLGTRFANDWRPELRP
jgi:uncharacterized protein DUF3810